MGLDDMHLHYSLCESISVSPVSVILEVYQSLQDVGKMGHSNITWKKLWERRERERVTAIW